MSDYGVMRDLELPLEYSNCIPSSRGLWMTHLKDITRLSDLELL